MSGVKLNPELTPLIPGGSNRPDHSTGEDMIAPNVESAITQLRDMVEAAGVVVPFTGAGISTECGIPDFRSPGGLWTTYKPVHFSDFLASAEMRAESWRRRFAMEARFSTATPGCGHLALASLHRLGKIPAVITQNIDSLHQASGFSEDDVVELHGNTTYAVCLDCSRRYEITWVRERFDATGAAPDCPSCGGFVKTATVSFGQAMPEAAMQRAERLASECDLFLAIGSSLVVWPAAGLPLVAKSSGAILVIINRDPTDFDDMADLVVHADIGQTLAPFITS